VGVARGFLPRVRVGERVVCFSAALCLVVLAGVPGVVRRSRGALPFDACHAFGGNSVIRVIASKKLADPRGSI
jgi:hypothetical protein